MTYSTAYPSPPVKQTSSHLRLVGEEESSSNDEQPSRQASRHMTVIEDAAVEEVARTCGMAALGLYCYLERRVGKDGRWTCSMASIAEAFNQSIRHIRDTAKALEDAGFLTRETVLGRGDVPVGVTWFLPRHKRAEMARTYDAEPTPEPSTEPTPEPSCARQEEISSYVVDTSNAPLPPTGGELPSRPLVPALTPTYISTLGELYPKLRKAFKELDPAFTDGWLRTTLLAAEQEIGPLSYEALFEGVDAALRSVRRTLEAERKGGKPIGALTPYAKAIIVSTLKEQRHAAV